MGANRQTVHISDMRAACVGAESSTQAFGKLLTEYSPKTSRKCIVDFLAAGLELMLSSRPSGIVEFEMLQREDGGFAFIPQPENGDQIFTQIIEVLQQCHAEAEVGLATSTRDVLRFVKPQGERGRLRVILTRESLVVGGKQLWDGEAAPEPDEPTDK